MPEADDQTQQSPENSPTPPSDDDASASAQGAAPVDDDPPPPPAEDPVVATLRDQVAALEARLRTVSAAYRNQQDEIKNIRDRLERQAAVDGERRRGEVVATLFEPTQNLRRAIKAIRDARVAEELVSGFDMTMHQYMDAFHKLGLEEVPGKGARFDPNLHEAIHAAPVDDPALDGVVLDVFSAGYRIGNRLITPARVIIGQKQEPAGEA